MLSVIWAQMKLSATRPTTALIKKQSWVSNGGTQWALRGAQRTLRLRVRTATPTRTTSTEFDASRFGEGQNGTGADRNGAEPYLLNATAPTSIVGSLPIVLPIPTSSGITAEQMALDIELKRARDMLHEEHAHSDGQGVSQLGSSDEEDTFIQARGGQVSGLRQGCNAVANWWAACAWFPGCSVPPCTGA